MTYKNNNKTYQSGILLLNLSITLILLSPTLIHAFSIPSKSFIFNDDRHLSAYNTNPNKKERHPRLEHTRRSSLASDNDVEEKDEEEGISSDPASTTAQLLESLWALIVKGCSMTKGKSATVNFPKMEETLTPQYVERLTDHLNMCKDVCENFGTSAALNPHVVKHNGRKKIAGFTVKSYRSEDATGTLSTTDGDYDFDYDPAWDDEDEGWDKVAAALRAAGEDDDDDFDDEEDDEEDLPEVVDKIPDNDEDIVDITKSWVRKLMSDMGVCPFTTGSDKAGVPIGPIYYTTDRCSSIEEMYLSYWKEVVRVETMPEDELSTTLLIAPNFCINAVELFEEFSTTLTKPLESLELENLLQLVFFHPEWAFRDGGDRGSAAANYARRSPWPMINILRTQQVRSAQRGIPTGLVYQQNERTLNNIGVNQLESMLRKRDWTDIEGVKVDRRDMEALRVAQDYQKTGIVKEEDMSFEFDTTPAANKVDEKQMEGGNMVNVVMQALEKRLIGGEDGGCVQLSGTETSAAMMASDFLLSQIDKAYGKPGAEPIEEKVSISEKSCPFGP